jgi:UDP-glucose 4-epimerase
MAGVAFVIGGCGFLGRRLVEERLAHGWRVGVIDPAASANGTIAFGGPGGEVHAVASAVTREALAILTRDLGAPGVIFQLGGSPSVGIAERDAALDRRLTVDSTRLLLESAPKSARIVLVSSAAVYGEAEGQLVESRALAPVSVYGRHKAEAEAIVTTRPNSAIVRFFSIYGPGLKKQLLWDACHKLRAGGIFGGTGEERRDFVHVDDAVALLDLAAGAPDDLIVNGGTGVATSVASAVDRLRTALGVGSPARFSGDTRPGDPPSLVADTARADSLGWRPQIDVQRGILEYARWFEAQAC